MNYYSGVINPGARAGCASATMFQYLFIQGGEVTYRFIAGDPEPPAHRNGNAVIWVLIPNELIAKTSHLRKTT